MSKLPEEKSLFFVALSLIFCFSLAEVIVAALSWTRGSACVHPTQDKVLPPSFSFSY